jgi:hypothetical protein
MSKLVSLDIAAQHLRLDDVDAEAELLELYLDAAEAHVESYLRRPLVPWNAEALTEQAPASVRAAILLVVGDLHQNRSANVEKPVSENATLVRLLALHRRGLGV